MAIASFLGEIKLFKHKKIITTIIVIIASTFLVSTAYAALPYTFEPETPAFAVEVNSNFNYLDNRVTALEGLPGSSGSSGSSSNCSSNNDEPLFTYNPKVAPLGTEFTLGNMQYILVKLPFVDIATGTKYVITLPVTSIGYQSIITKWAVDTSKFCSTTTISSYPLKSGSVVIERYFTGFNSTEVDSSKLRLLAFIKILVGKTVVSFFLSGWVTETLKGTPVTTLYDFTDPTRFDDMTTPTQLLQSFDDMIDYIIIEKAP